MPNPFVGVLNGLASTAWQDYDARLRAFAFAGSPPTQPNNLGGTNFGRYFDTGTGLVVFQFRFAFNATTTFGSGDDVWGVKLPIPANRSSNAADLPNGTALAWQGSAASPQLMIPLRPTLMDPEVPGGNNGDEDDYVQFFLPFCVASGSSTITSAATNVVVTHGLGMTPLANDLTLTPTATVTNNVGTIFIDTITSTTFRVNVKAAPGAGGMPFAWKARCEPNNSTTLALLANHARPFAFASGSELSGLIIYEARL